MKKILLTAALASAIPAISTAANPPGAVNPVRPGNDIMRFLPKAKCSGLADDFVKVSMNSADTKSVNSSASRLPAFDTLLPAADETGYLDGPLMETYFYTLDYDKESIDHGSWVETVIKGYTVTVYDPEMKAVGAIHDTVTLTGNETKVAGIGVGPQLTKKFFNTDNTLEIMICVYKNTSEYVNSISTVVYSLGVDEPVAELPGMYVSCVNTATDNWSEKFYITFLTEEETETPMVGDVLNTVDYAFSTYKYAGYNGMEDPILSTRVPVVTISGENSIPFISTTADGIPYFCVNHMKYSWFEDPYDYTNENPTADNELIVDIYSLPSAYGQTVEKFSTTTIPSEASIENLYFMYIGTFSYDKDISVGKYSDDGTPSLILTREYYRPGSDDYSYSYDVYTAAPKGETTEGKQLFTLAERVDGGYFMPDIEGHDPQVMFVKQENDEFRFDFVSLLDGTLEHTIPYYIEGDLFFNTTATRVPYEDSYLYAVAQTHGESDPDGNVWTNIVYLDTDANVHHIDRLNMGKNIDYAKVYMAPEALDPFIFNLDDAREYMLIVKRRDPGASGNHEELLVLSADENKPALLTLTPDEELGSLATIFLSNLDSDTPSLMAIYAKDYRYTLIGHTLPLKLYEAGDGTIENPYEITSVGGLKMIKANPDAHYVITRDIDAEGHILSPSMFTFTGTLDGQNHIISNLELRGRSLIPFINRAEKPSDALTVGNIRFLNPSFMSETHNQGLLVGEMTGGRISNVHVYEGNIHSSSSVSGLVGGAYLSSVIEGCSVNADIVSEDGTAAGIVAATRTSSAVKACAFSGTITGTSEVGGIVGSIGNANDIISDCHVNAKIKANNTVGGIAGTSARGLISRCHVQGSIEATEAPRWGGGPKAGGVVGELSQFFASEDNKTPGVAVENCFVNLSSISYTGETAQENFPGQNNSMHRIVGYSAVNNEPEVIDYDSDWNPIYGDPNEPEAGLVSNYAVSSLPVCSEEIMDATDSTEGKSVSRDELSKDFFMQLGFNYGDEIDNPWSASGDMTSPSLFFEGGLLMLTPAQNIMKVGESITLSLSLAAAEITEDMIEGFSFNISDESVIECTDTKYDNGCILIELSGLAVGTARVDAYLAGKQASAIITVSPGSGSDMIQDMKNGIDINLRGRMVTAEDCDINVFSADGMNVAHGHGYCDLSALSSGIYIVTAHGSNGSSSVKISLRR